MNNRYKKAMDKIEISDALRNKIINNTSKPKENKTCKYKPMPFRKLAGLAACFVLCFLSYYTAKNYYIQPNTDIVSVDSPNAIPDNTDLRKKTAANEPVQEQPPLKINPDKSEEPTTVNPPAHKNAEGNSTQAAVVLPKQEVTTEDASSAADNSLPAFSKGKVSAGNTTVILQISTVEEASAVLGYEIQTPQYIPTGYAVSSISVVQKSIAEIVYQGENDIITYRTAKSSEDLSRNDDTYTFMEIVNVNMVDIVLKGKAEFYYNAIWSENADSFSITSDTGIEKDLLIAMVSSVACTVQPDTDTEN